MYLAILAACFLLAAPSPAAELTSTNYRHRAGAVASFAAAGSGAMISTTPGSAFGAASASLGEPVALAPMGSSSTGEAALPGFWPIVFGASPNLDQDGDDLPWFLDSDDDGDGLLDEHESSTGVYVSPTDTGSSPFEADSDGDGFSDGLEVSSGSDPNSAASTPSAPAVPAGSFLPRALLLVALLMLGALALVPTRRSSS